MIFVNKSKFHSITSLYDFFDEKMQVMDASVEPLSIKRVKDKEDMFFLIDPEIEELKLIIDLEKEVVVMFTMLHEDYLDLLKSSQVKQVIVIDDLDALMLKKRAFNKFAYAAPFDINEESIQSKDFKELTHSCLCYEDISNLTESDVSIMKSLPDYNIKTIYSGFKVITKKTDFYNLKLINDSAIVFKSFPIFEPLREINMILYTLSFPKGSFPIVAAVSAANKNIPLIFSQRYYNWVLTEFQTPSKETMNSLINVEDRQDLREKQFELFTKFFTGRPTIKEVLSEYDKPNEEVQKPSS